MEFNTKLIIRFVVFVILSLHLVCLFKVKGHCPKTIKHRVLQSKFRLRRLLNTADWLGCILACNNEPGCFSYHFCFRDTDDSGVCDLNGCWVENNGHYRDGEDSLLVYASDCVFQQLSKKIEGFPVCRREVKKQPTWIKANLSPKCLKTTASVQFNMPKSGQLTGLKLAYVEGHITCNKSDPKCAGRWGCSCCKTCIRGYTDRRLDIVVTNANRNRIFPSNRYPSMHGIWYSLPHQRNEDPTLVFPYLTVPLTIAKNEPLVVWYSSHLLSRGSDLTSNSDGRVCFDVYAFYTKMTD